MSSNSRRVLNLALIVIITAVVSGSTVYLWQKIHEDVIKNPLTGSHDRVVGSVSEVKQSQSTFFKVYGAGPGAMDSDGEINFHVAVPDTLPLLAKLSLLADRLSRFKFSYLPIEVTGIEEQGGARVAVVNLRETEWNRKVFAEYERALRDGLNADSVYRRIAGATWRQYFSGSTGGHFTALTLTKTFLQPDYEGEWIDGVQFLYEGNPIRFDHVPGLRRTRYREEW